MTPSQKAKAAGHKSLAAVSKALGQSKSGHPLVSTQTLRNWSKNKPLLFEAVLRGVSDD